MNNICIFVMQECFKINLKQHIYDKEVPTGISSESAVRLFLEHSCNPNGTSVHKNFLTMQDEKHFVDNGQGADATPIRPTIGFKFNNHSNGTPVTVVCEDHPEMTDYVNKALYHSPSRKVQTKILESVGEFFEYAHCYEYIQANMEVLDAWIKQSQNEKFPDSEIRQRTFMLNFVSRFLAEINHLNEHLNQIKNQSKNSER